MRLYDKLRQRKRRDEQLDMQTMTRETLYQLWWQEECTDSMIAGLYDVPRKKVTNLRHKWGVKTPETILDEFEQQFAGVIPDQETAVPSKPRSQDADWLLRKIGDLNDLELESLRLELARRYPVFAEARQEVDFLALVERAVRQFGQPNGM